MRASALRVSCLLALVIPGLTACLADEPLAPAPSFQAPRDANAPADARTRVYYVAADDVLWYYTAPGATTDLISGMPFTAHPHAGTFVLRGVNRIGAGYWKMLYREYRDASFTTLGRQGAGADFTERWSHLGTLGPVLQAQVGDTIKVVFRNNTSQPVSMHPHGVFYDKGSEGAPYCTDEGECSPRPGDAVAPGATVTYIWPVPERAGPGPMDGSSILWMYHSHVDESRDTNSGLVGPIIVTRRGHIRDDGRPTDVDREFVMLYTVSDENSSWLLERSLDDLDADRLLHGNRGNLEDDDDFVESNLMHGINGWVYGYQPLASVTMKKGEKVRWYLLSVGTEVDLHTPHWHGQTGLFQGMRTDIIELLPASMKVFDMEPDNSGVWLFHCHVNDHIDAGMLTRFRVE